MTPRTLLPLCLALPLTLTGCGDKDDDSGATDGATDGSDGGTDGTSDGTDGASDGTDGAATGNCAADPGADTVCVDLLGETVEITGGIAWDGQGSLDGSAMLVWGGGDSHTEPPSVVLQVDDSVSAGDTVGCDVRPNAISYTDAAGDSWFAIVDFEYYGSSCSVTLDQFSLTPGDEISGTFTAEAVNGDYTADPMSGSFRATVAEF